jgi:hypothetical protein
MNTQDENRDIVQTSAYNPFPEPQTIPSGWDTSGFFYSPEPFELAQGSPASAIDEEDTAES